MEVKAQIEERKVLDISRLKDDDLNAIERVLEHAVIDGDPSGENAEVTEAVHSGILEDNRART